MTGGHEEGMSSFEGSPHDWGNNEESISKTLLSFAALHITLCANLRYSTIEPDRVVQLRNTLLYDLHRFIPEAPPVYSESQVLVFDEHLKCVRDHKEVLPHDQAMQRVYEEVVVMM